MIEITKAQTKTDGELITSARQDAIKALQAMVNDESAEKISYRMMAADLLIKLYKDTF